jgi:hypothetical protein
MKKILIIAVLVVIVVLIGGMTRSAPDVVSVFPQKYTDSVERFSFQYPDGYTLDTTHAYGMNPNVTIAGVKIQIPASLATGTNLSADTYLSVEHLPLTSECTAERFLDGITSTTTEVHNGITYSVLTLSGAGAGNRYEETVYATPGARSCLAIRYFIHSTVLENYDPGTRTQFDAAALHTTFDAIRDTLTLD